MAATAEAKQSEPQEDTQTETHERPDVDLDEAHAIVQRNVYWAMGAGVLPLPIVDIVATTGVQLKMLRELSKLYGVPFREGAAKKAVTSLLVGIGGVGIGGLIGGSLIKIVPVIGQSLGVVSIPVVSGMLTHSVGRTFVMHFEAGGSLLDFNAKKMRKYFREEYGRSKDVVEEMQDNEAAGQPEAAPA